MSKYTMKTLKVFARILAITIGIGAIIYNPGHLFSALLIWFGANELITVE